jgi:DNA-binding PadR family transcriptional regulator
MGGRAFLGEFEQMVLLAVLRLGEAAFGPGIAEELEERAGRQVSRGALYATLDRLERKGYLTWAIEAPTSESRGNRRRRFNVTPAGIEELVSVKEAYVSLWEGLDGVLRRPTG